MKTPLKYTTLIDFILRTLFDAKKEYPNNYLSLISVLDVLNYPYSFNEIVEIGEYMEAKGYVNISKSLGDIFVQLSSVGKIYIEDKNESFHEEYSEYLKKVMKKKKNKELTLQSFLPKENPKARLIRLVNKIVRKVREKEGNESDYLNDVKIIKLELEKSNPNIQILEMKLTSLNELTYIISELSELRNYLMHSSL